MGKLHDILHRLAGNDGDLHNEINAMQTEDEPKGEEEKGEEESADA